MNVRMIEINNLCAHKKNPRIEPRQDVVDQITSQIQARGSFDQSHALIVREIGEQYQIISGHHRWLAAQKAGLSEAPCWVKEMTDEQAYMELVLCNTQSELHPLEEGKHAAESGMDLKAYAEASGKERKNLQNKLHAWRVLSVSHMGHAEVADSWRNLAEIHAAPNWLWSALVKQMIESSWTVQLTRDKVKQYKEIDAPPAWSDSDKIAESLVAGTIKINEIAKFATLVDKANVRNDNDSELRKWMMEALSDAIPSRLSEVQSIVAEWEKKQSDIDNEAKRVAAEKQKAEENALMRIAKLRSNISLDEWKTLNQEEKDLLIVPSKGEGGVFNKQESKDIEWAQWSWNPVTGCLHNCSYCYARDIANMQRMVKAYPNGFAPSFRSNALNAPRNTKIPDESKTDARFKNVFTCSMADLFGRWVPKEWIDAVMKSVRENNQWDFLFLTKFPQRLSEVDIPENAWMGTTVDLQARVHNAEKAFEKVNCKIKWLSVEPMIEPLKFTRLDLFDWVVIGGASVAEGTKNDNGENQKWEPPFEWIYDLVTQCREAGTKIYMKSNLGIANRILELPFDLPLKQDPKVAPKEYHYLGK